MNDDWLDRLESLVAEADAGVAVVTVASVAGRAVELGDVRADVRRALLVLAAGGDPERGLDLNGPAVERFAEELETPERRTSLDAGLERLAADALGHAHTSELVHALRQDPETAWRAFACSVLAEHLGD